MDAKMEEVMGKQIKQKNYLLIVLAIISGLLGVLSFVFHVSPKTILGYLAEFSKHHYLTASVTLIIAAVIALKVAHKDEVLQKVGYGKKITQGRSSRQRMRFLRRRISMAFKSNSRDDGFKYVTVAQLYFMQFPEEEVLQSRDDQQALRANIEKAVLLAKTQRQKVVICFKAKDGDKYTIATLSAVQDKHIALQDGTKLPLNSIYKIEL